jgi:hypothetical protein
MSVDIYPNLVFSILALHLPFPTNLWPLKAASRIFALNGIMVNDFRVRRLTGVTMRPQQEVLSNICALKATIVAYVGIRLTTLTSDVAMHGNRILGELQIIAYTRTRCQLLEE